MVVKDNNVFCDNCGKSLFKTDKKGNGHIASQASKLGFVVKHTLFYGGTEFKVFCDKECCRKWFSENVSKENWEKGNKRAEEFKKDLTSPKSVQALQRGIEAIHKLASHPEQLQILLQKYKKRKRK